MVNRPNLICIISDTLRTAYLGCYGNEDINTPNLDAFAQDATIFDHAYPESLPTIQVRRAMHSGRRAFPFRDYEPVRWDHVYLPGWQPLDNGEDTLAENLVRADYHTGFVTDTLPYFAPGFNFRRGFWQWEFIRGQQQDRWKSAANVTKEDLEGYEGDPEEMKKRFPRDLTSQHIANTRHVCSEEKTTTARTFRWAMDFAEDNRHAQPFYLLIDCFNPHEPWEAPQPYLEMYEEEEYEGETVIHPEYGSADGYLNQREIDHIIANYKGLVSLVDTWFGNFIQKLKRLGIYEDSVIAFISDHGTNFADNPENIIGKPHDALYPGVMKLPLIVRTPDGVNDGLRVDELSYNLDVTATMYDYAGLLDEVSEGIDGKSLAPLTKKSESEEKHREYLTCRYGNTVWYFDKNWWIFFDISGETLGAFDYKADPDCTNNMVGKVEDGVIDNAWETILDDADGELTTYESTKSTDAIGRTEGNYSIVED